MYNELTLLSLESKINDIFFLGEEWSGGHCVVIKARDSGDLSEMGSSSSDKKSDRITIAPTTAFRQRPSMVNLGPDSACLSLSVCRERCRSATMSRNDDTARLEDGESGELQCTPILLGIVTIISPTVILCQWLVLVALKFAITKCNT